MGEKNSKKPFPGKVYAPTSAEEPVLRAYLERANARVAPRVKVDNNEGVKIAYDHPDETVAMVLSAAELGATDGDFYDGLIQQLANVSSHGGEVDERTLNFILSVIKDVKP